MTTPINSVPGSAAELVSRPGQPPGDTRGHPRNVGGGGRRCLPGGRQQSADTRPWGRPAGESTRRRTVGESSRQTVIRGDSSSTEPGIP